MKAPVEKAFTLSLITSIHFNMLLVVVKELVPEVKFFMKTYLLHHWLGHGIFVFLFFFLTGIVLSNINIKPSLEKMPLYIILSIIISTLVISGFYISHVH